MKRFIKLCAFPLMASVMTACTSNEDIAVPQKADNAIGFSVISQNMTRAANTYGSSFAPSKIKVTAYDGENNYFGTTDNIDLLTYSDASKSWTSPKTRYWPKNKDENWAGLTFYAFVDDNDMAYSANAVANVGSTFELNNGAPQFKDFVVNEDVAKQKDLMYAVTTGVKNTESNKGVVPLHFRHALSQVCFMAQNNDPNLCICIESIELHGISGKGTYTFPTSMSTTDANIVPAEGNTRWEISNDGNDKTNYIIKSQESYLASLLEAQKKDDGNYEGFTYNISVPGKPYCSDPDGVPEGSSIPSEEDILSSAMNLLPQQVNAAETELGEGAFFIINASIDSYYNNTSSYSEERIFLPVDIDWKEGQRYTYKFVWNPGEAIAYTMTFSDYNNNNTQEQEITPNKDYFYPVKMRPDTDPDGPLTFAACNIGADRPCDAGLYFWWGDVVGHRAVRKGSTFEIEDGFVFSTSNTSITTYTEGKIPSELVGTVLSSSDAATCQFTTEYDAAKQLCGDEWFVPKQSDFEWLSKEENCEWHECDGNEGTIQFTYKEKGDNEVVKYRIPGYFVKSKKTGGIIFLPSVGSFTANSSSNNYNTGFYYWTCTPGGEEDGFFGTYFRYRDSTELYGTERSDGFCIRPVMYK